MSATTRFVRPKSFDAPNQPAASREQSTEWIGMDFSREVDRRRFKALIPLLLMALVAALGIAALRIDLIRTRYAVAAATKNENALMEERRALIARKRSLRDPTELAVEARKRGFRPPAHVYSVRDPVVAGSQERTGSAAHPLERARP